MPYLLFVIMEIFGGLADKFNILTQ